MEIIISIEFRYMRKLFTDGANSAWHLFFGMLAVRFWFIIPIFILYQLYDFYDKNLLIDFSEFAIGYILVIYIRLWYFNKI